MMKSNKTLGLDGIPIEALKNLGEEGVFTILINKIIITRKMSDD